MGALWQVDGRPMLDKIYVLYKIKYLVLKNNLIAMTHDLTVLVGELNNMVSQGKLLEAFDKYYADDISMQENETTPRVGKAVNRTAEEGFVNGLTSFSAQPTAIAYGDNLSIVEWLYDFNHKEWGAQKKIQVAVQHWKDGKIVKEKFYYNTAK